MSSQLLSHFCHMENDRSTSPKLGTELQTVVSFASVLDGGFSVLLCVVCFVLVSSYLKHSMYSVRFSLPGSFLSLVFTDSWDSSYLLYKSVLELCFSSVAILRINAKSYTGEEGCTTLLGHLGSGPRSFLLPPLPPLIFRDVAKAEEEGSPFGRVVCFS